jgi:hypothetical protein
MSFRVLKIWASKRYEEFKEVLVVGASPKWCESQHWPGREYGTCPTFDNNLIDVTKINDDMVVAFIQI